MKNKTVPKEETIANEVIPNDEPEEKIPTTSSTLPSAEREHGAGDISEEVEYVKTKEYVTINLDVVTGAEITGKQTHETNELEEITSSPLVSLEKEEDVSSVEKIEEEKLSDAEIPEKISEKKIDEKKSAETFFENEAIKELNDAKNNTQALQMEESNEQFFTSELPVENLKHRTEANTEEEVKEVEILEKEGPQESEAVINQETIVARAITEEARKKGKKHEESEHETKEKEDEQTSEGEIIKYEIEEYASDAKTTVEICSQKGSSVEVEAVAEDEMTADSGNHKAEKIESKKIKEAEFLRDDSGEDATLQKELLQGDETLVLENNASSQTIPKEKPEEKIRNLVVTLPSEDHEQETINEVDKTEEEKRIKELSTEQDQTEEAVAVLKEDESLVKIREQTGEIEESSDINMEIHEKALNSELLHETEDAAIKENLGKAIAGSGGEANQFEKINEGNEIIPNEVSKEQVASHSTYQLEEPTKEGEDALKDKLIEEKTYEELNVEAQKTSENEITEKQIEDGAVKNPGQESVVRAETTTVTEDHIENKGITSSVVEEHVLIDLHERVVECSQKAEVRDVKEIYPEVVEHGVGKTVNKPVEDSTTVSSCDDVESFKETADEIMSKVEIVKDKTVEDASDTRTTVEICSQIETSVKLEAATEDEKTSGQTLTAKKSEGQMQNPTSAPHSKEEQCVRASIAEEIESEKMEQVKFLQDDNEDVTLQKKQLQGDEALAVENNASLQTIPTEKSEEQIPNPVVTLSSEKRKNETVNEVDKPEEEHMKKEEMKSRDFDGEKTVEELSTEKDETKGAAAMSEGEISRLRITTSALPSDVQGDETNKTESNENESPKKIPEQTGRPRKPRISTQRYMKDF
ncbi:altered inheritance of mitochondria protein 21-like [Hibiscus syriacus]|uniref:altered inheritance of mitochondria protein 21-like n=1 Tax=Hibiscus syriacus TaxID=106335 RepID=UPI001924199D|nr:altered inheritance of mitochondria protein 21-like [Hibiscus syriacus]